MTFETVTELPGNKAHQEQIDAMRTRYEWAASFCANKDVLEIACGAGLGLGLIGNKAKSVIGGDIDPLVLDFAEKQYKNKNIKVISNSAEKFKINNKSVDVIICFEAIYYFKTLNEFLSETQRTLRKNGVLLISSVNCNWHGFNPSKFYQRYYSIEALKEELAKNGFKSEFFVCFEDNPKTFKKKVLKLIRSVAVFLGFIPKTMKGKQWLKRLFYGKLNPLPNEIDQSFGTNKKISRLIDDIQVSNYKFYYCIATLN
jgi:ubiquinone/menaquinone biosynthesis C-methylase UbiE